MPRLACGRTRASFADGAWPEEVREDGLLDQGFGRANAMLRPTRYGNASRPHQISRP